MTDSEQTPPPCGMINVTIALPREEYKLARDHSLRLGIHFKELLRRWIAPHVQTLRETEQLNGGDD